MKLIETASVDELADIKKWFFKENIRLAEEKQRLEEERKILEKTRREIKSKRSEVAIEKRQLEQEQKIFEQKFQILQRELYKLAEDKKHLQEEKEKVKRIQKPKTVFNEKTDVFFIGVDSKESLKKRYKALSKIYHPDNMNGDAKLIQEINRLYDVKKGLY